MNEIGKEIPLRLVYIEPYSVVILRGGVFHSGADGEESGERRCARFHMYMMRQGVAFGDTFKDYVGRYMEHNTGDAKKTGDELVKRF